MNTMRKANEDIKKYQIKCLKIKIYIYIVLDINISLDGIISKKTFEEKISVNLKIEEVSIDYSNKRYR